MYFPSFLSHFSTSFRGMSDRLEHSLSFFARSPSQTASEHELTIFDNHLAIDLDCRLYNRELH